MNHGLRDVASEVALVRDTATSLGLRFRELPVAVKPETGSLQGDAREARLHALEVEAKRIGARKIATGHTQSDQAETVLFRLIRGSGLRGLGAIRPQRDRYIRPLLSVSREDTASYLRDIGQEWMEDPSNDDTRFMRSRIRHQLIPLLDEWVPGVEARIAATAESLQEVSELMEQEGSRSLSKCVVQAKKGLLVLSVRELRGVRSRLLPVVFQRALERVGTFPVKRAHIRATQKLLDGEKGTVSLDFPGVFVSRVYDELRFSSREQIETCGAEQNVFSRGGEEIPGPGCYRVGTCLLTIDSIPFEEVTIGKSANEEFFDEEQITFPLCLRALVKGDRMQPFGFNGTKLVSDILIDRKIPRERRNALVALTDGTKMLWLVAVSRSNLAPLGEGTQRVWRMRCETIS